MSYDEERLGELLRLLPEVPEGWVRAAQELPAARAALETLVARAEADAAERERIVADLEAALVAEGVDPALPSSPSFARVSRRCSARACATGDQLATLPFSGRSAMIEVVHRKVVTVLFCDVVGSTALGESIDPEALQALLARYFERMKAIVERHGGTVEKFIGDAVMAVFGVPAVHEDDALRACRAAVEMRDGVRRARDRRGGSASTPARSSPAPRSGSPPATRSTSPRGSSRRPSRTRS